MSDARPLRDRIALVTGASSGVGLAISSALAAAGARLCLTGRNAQRLESAATAARTAGAHAATYEADLTLDGDIERLAAGVSRDVPGLDVLVHSAGTIVLGPVASAPIDAFDRQFRANLRGPYLLTQRLLPLIVARRGQIVFINSSAGVRALAGVSQYAATKHGLKAVADSLREEVRTSGVRVLSVFPGRIATPMQAALQNAEGRTYDPAQYLDPRDVASLVVNALSLDSAEVKEIDVRPRTP